MRNKAVDLKLEFSRIKDNTDEKSIKRMEEIKQNYKRLGMDPNNLI
jgi:hypothetical protein